jgi:hypothetical protein
MSNLKHSLNSSFLIIIQSANSHIALTKNNSRERQQMIKKSSPILIWENKTHNFGKLFQKQHVLKQAKKDLHLSI